MKLFYAATSPFVRKIMVLLHETGNLAKVEILPAVVSPINRSDEVAARNPLGKIPALDRDDGPALFDSRVICAYLDDLFSSGLYPKGAGHWETLTLEAMADGVMDAAILMTYEGRLRPKDKQWDEWSEGQWAKVAGACDGLNARWMSHLSGPLDMGQIAVACALAYVDFRHPDRDWRTGNEALAKWFAEFESRDSMQATIPPA